MKRLALVAVLFAAGVAPALAVPNMAPAPSPEMDLGLAAMLMVAGAGAFIALRRRG